MKTSTAKNLLNAAAYVRNETIVSGTQAAYLDAVTGSIKTYLASIAEAPGKIAELETAGTERGANMWRRILERDQKELAELCAQLRAWLVDFKNNRPNVQINIEETEEQTTTTPETPNPDNTPATMNANDNEYLDRLRYVNVGSIPAPGTNN